MRIATWVIQERERAVTRAVERLTRRTPQDAGELRVLVDVVSRALEARLNDAALHERTVADLRARYPAARLGGATAALAAELRDLAALHSRDGADLDRNRRIISEAADEVSAALDPAGAQPLARDEGPRPTLLHALSEFAARPLPTAEAPRPVRSVLRMRARTLHAARALRAAAEDAARIAGVQLEPSAADEVVCSTWREGEEGVVRLVRVVAALATTASAAAADIAYAVVAASEDAAATAWHASSLLRTGELVMDEASWSAVSARIAAVPGQQRTADPRAPFGTDRLEQSALLLRPPMCGRDAEREALAQEFRAPSDRATLTVLYGPPGIGKSTLLRAALTDAGYDDDAAPVLWGAANADVPIPYAALTAMLRAAAGAPATSAAVRSQVEHMFALLAEHLPPLDRAALAHGAAAVLPILGVGDDEELRSPRSQRLALRRAFVGLVAALWARAGAARPVVLVVTQAEAVDAPTRDVLELCADRMGGRLRVVFLTAGKPRAYAGLERAFAVRSVELGPLSHDAVLELVAQTLGGVVEPELASLLGRARGSPLHALQVVRFMVECGWLRPGEGFVAHPQARDVPQRIDKLLALRVERLAVEPRRFFATCALLGPTFSQAAAELIGVRLGMNHDDVAHALTVLVDTGALIRLEQRPGRPLFAPPGTVPSTEPTLFAFEHPLLRTAAAQALAKEELPRAHALVAEAFEALAPADSSALAVVLARHHRLAGAPDKALGPLLVAVRRSARLDDREGAVELARAALALCSGDAVLSFPFLRELCRVREQGPRKQHLAALQELVRCAEITRDPRRRAEALLGVVRFNLRRGDPALAAEACERAMVELRGLGDARLELTALRLLVVARAELGDVEHVERLHGEILARVPASDRSTHAALAHLSGTTLLAAGDIGSAVERLSRALVDARAAGDPAAEASCLESLALAYGQVDRPALALGLVERAQVRLEPAGDAHGRGRLAIVRAELLLAAGDDAGALHESMRARATAAESDDERIELRALLVAARAHLALGDAELAGPLLDQLRKRARDEGMRAAVAAAMARARVLRARESTGPARERLLRTAVARAREALAFTEGVEASPAIVMQAAAALAEALLLEGDADAAFPHAQRAVEHVEDGPSGPWLDEALLASARVARAMHDDDELREVRARARDILARRAGPLDAAARVRFYAAPTRAELLEGEAGPHGLPGEAA